MSNSRTKYDQNCIFIFGMKSLNNVSVIMVKRTPSFLRVDVVPLI